MAYPAHQKECFQSYYKILHDVFVMKRYYKRSPKVTFNSGNSKNSWFIFFFPPLLRNETVCPDVRSIEDKVLQQHIVNHRVSVLYWFHCNNSTKSRKLKTLGFLGFFSARISVSAPFEKKLCGHSHQMQKQAQSLNRLLSVQATSVKALPIITSNSNQVIRWTFEYKNKHTLWIACWV